MHKQRLADLAILGGRPAFQEKLFVGRPNIGNRTRLLNRINDVLDRRWLTNAGAYVREFEKRVAETVGARNCVATCNGAVALEIAIRALDLRGEVIVPAFTFIATAHALQWQQITPVFADVDPQTHLIDPSSAACLVTPRTSAILGVHTWGRRCDVEGLERLAARHRLHLLFDAAHAFGCGQNGRLVGSFGELEVFSFHATKFVNSLEGGAIVTDNDELAQKMRLMKNFGFLGYDNVGTIGTNGKMNEFSAAMGLTSIESMDAFVTANRRNYERYVEELSGIPGVRVLPYDPSQRSNYQYVVTEIEPPFGPISRDRLLDVLWAENVMARRYFYPGCHRMQPYRSMNPDAWRHLPQTERISSRVLVLPTGETVSSDDVSSVCSIIRIAAEHGGELTHRLEQTDAVHSNVLAS